MEIIPHKEIDSIVFSINTSEDIIKNSVCKVYTAKLVGQGSVYDERMGTMENSKKCLTCDQGCKDCPGHFGYIELNTPIIHPLYYRQVIAFLKCFCMKCYSFVLDEDHLKLDGLMKYHRENRFDKILLKLEKIDYCYKCENPRPKITFLTTENTIEISYNKNKVAITDEEVKKIFDNISDDDIRLLGFNPSLVHPKNLILSYFPVLPPIARPYIVSENIICDDDLTISYLEIVKANNHLVDKDINETKRTKYIQTLKFRIKTLMNNSNGKSRHTNGRPLKAIKERLTGKEGLIRNNLMGKRTNQSGRTVIGPDPTLRTDEMAIPQKIANTLTVPERVCSYNMEWLEKLVNSGGANYVLRNNQKVRINLDYATRGRPSIVDGREIIGQQRYFKLQDGDVVERKLKNGDVVLLNRQPTLHKGSMLAKKIVIRPHKTFRFSLASTKTFNADFDGDEMNIHVPQQYDARAELLTLSTTKSNIMSSQSSKSNISIVQDSLLGSYLMTKKKDIIPIAVYNDLLMRGDKWSMEYIETKMSHIRNTLKQLGRDENMLYTGKGLISFMLPDDFFYVKKTNADPKEPFVRIYKGVLYEGVFNKSIVGSVHNSIIQVLHKEYDENICMDFLNNIQFITNGWLCHYGFSIGVKDCVLNDEKNTEEMIQKTVIRCFMEAKKIEEMTQHPKIKEAKINATLSKAKDIGMKLAKDTMSEDNGFVSTVISGSKGDFFNIAQISGIVGQQNVSGGRIQPVMNRGRRTLPHYPFSGMELEEEFESRGFVKNSFLRGLTPQEFWFHAMSGREGVSDSAMKTAQSGYIQRKMVKVMEDVQIRYDGTVRNSSGSIIQWAYGDDNMDRCQTVVLDNQTAILDIERLAEKLNNTF